MALVLADRVRETTTTAGTGTITLLGAVPSCQSFAVVGNGNTTYYTIVAYTGTEYEVGIGTYTASGTTLSRDTVLASSNGGSLVNFSAGTKDVFVDYPAGKAVLVDGSGNTYAPNIGGTTASAGTFTTLTATGQTSLGGVAGAEGLRVTPLASSTTYINARAGVNGGNAQFGLNGTGNTDFIQYTLGTGAFRFLTNGIGVDQFRIAHTASAVNYVQVTGAPTGNDSTISAQGSDANTGLIFLSKGSTGLTFRTRGGGTARNALVLVDNGSSSVNYLQIQSNLSTTAPSLSAQGSDTNIPLVLQPKGTGALQAQQTDSTATGGNARGGRAVDWQMSRDAGAYVASGSFSVLSGGASNVTQGTLSFVGGGQYNSGAGSFSTVVGGFNNSTSGAYSFTGSGSTNVTSGQYASIVGGLLNGTNTSTGYLSFVGGGSNNTTNLNTAVTTQSATMNGTTAVTLAASNANIKVGQLITGTSIVIGSNTTPFTYVAAISGTSLTLSQAASGSSTSTLSFFTPHGVVVGGGNNQATGSYSFIGGGGDAGTAANRNVASGDWSFVGGGQKNTTSAAYSTVSGGGGNTASQVGAVICGGGAFGANPSSFLSNTASGLSSFIGAGLGNSTDSSYSAVIAGVYGRTRGIQCNHVFAASNNPMGSFQSGQAQAALVVLGKQTTDATATTLTIDGNIGATTNQVILPNNSAYYFRGEVVSGVTGGGNTKGWFIEGVIKRGANAASTALVGTPTVTSLYADAGASTWVIAVTADTTNGGLAVTFTGQASTTIRTVARVNTVEMTF